MTTDGKRRFLINFAYFICVTAILYFFFKFAILFLMPFFAAYVIAAMLRPLAESVSEKTRLPHKYASLLVVVLFYSTVGALLFILCAELIDFAGIMIGRLPEFYSSTVEPTLKSLLSRLTGTPDDPDKSLYAMISGLTDALSSFGDVLSELSSFLVGRVSEFAMAMPATVVKIVFAVIASFYFVADYGVISDFIKRQLPKSAAEKLREARLAVRGIVLSYVRSYTIIMGITFCELLLAFLILRVPGAVLIAALIAVFDILPVVGTGTVLLPWIAVEIFVNGSYGMAAGLAVSYVVIFIVRNVIEPKIVGHGVGLHPLATLAAMFVGTALFGFVGLFGVPILAALLVDLNDRGVINVFNKET